MSSADRHLIGWSTEDDSIIRTVVIVLVTLVLAASLFQDTIMDLLDAWMELPYDFSHFLRADVDRSFADIPLILKDRVRGFARRGLRMQAPLVLRPFARGNGLITSDRGGVAGSTSSSLSFWSNSGDGGDDKDVAPQAGMSLSDRFRGRRWNTSDDENSTRTLKVPGLVNTGNFCFMNSVLQVIFSSI